MIPNAWQGFDFGLGEDIDMLRETTRELFRRQDRAARRRDRQDQHLPARSVAADGRARPARHHGRGGIRRLGARLSRPLRGDGGNLARLGLGRPVLRRAFQPLRQPDPAHRHRRPAPKIPAEADFRRARRRAGDVGARRRLRRGVDAHPRRQEGRPLHPQRLEILDHQRPGGRDPGGLCQDRPGRRRPRHHRLPDREGDEGIFHRAEARQARHARLRHRRTGVSRTARCRPRTCSARSAAASTC